jgi:hypothetical protein
MVKPGIVSATVGISGNCGERSAVDIARRQFPALPKFARSGEIEMSLAFDWV